MLFTFTDNAFEIGFLTKSRLKKLYQDGDISEHQMNTFYKAASARRFFERAFRYALDSLPHQDELLFNAQCVNWEMRRNDISDSLQHFIERLEKR